MCAIINPLKGRKSPNLGKLHVMISSEPDLLDLCRLMNLNADRFRKLMMSRIYEHEAGVSFSGPVIGAPYAVMVMETVAAWGAQQIIFFGWCGSIANHIKTGDIIVPDAAVIDEGTSRHYNATEDMAVPCPDMTRKIKSALTKAGIAFNEGAVWSTDAIYRETCEKVASYQEQGLLAVEMELSALFTVGKFRNVSVGGILVVSDELATFTWQPGFKNERFKESRKAVTEAVCGMMKKNEE